MMPSLDFLSAHHVSRRERCLGEVHIDAFDDFHHDGPITTEPESVLGRQRVSSLGRNQDFDDLMEPEFDMTGAVRSHAMALW